MGVVAARFLEVLAVDVAAHLQALARHVFEAVQAQLEVQLEGLRVGLAQVAAGLILTYSNTLRKGEYVRVGEHEGTVLEVGAFNTRIRTGLGEEIVLPNNIIASSATKNYSREVQGPGYIVDTVVTIGYDTPWRQVEAMLLEAARIAWLRGDLAEVQLGGVNFFGLLVGGQHQASQVGHAHTTVFEVRDGLMADQVGVLLGPVALGDQAVGCGLGHTHGVGEVPEGDLACTEGLLQASLGSAAHAPPPATTRRPLRIVRRLRTSSSWSSGSLTW